MGILLRFWYMAFCYLGIAGRLLVLAKNQGFSKRSKKKIRGYLIIIWIKNNNDSKLILIKIVIIIMAIIAILNGAKSANIQKNSAQNIVIVVVIVLENLIIIVHGLVHASDKPISADLLWCYLVKLFKL